MSMPSTKDQVMTFKSEMKNSLSDIISAYKSGHWSEVNTLTAMFPNTPYDSASEYISPDIKVPTQLEKLIDDISYMTQSKRTVNNYLNKLEKQSFPNLIEEAHTEKLM